MLHIPGKSQHRYNRRRGLPVFLNAANGLDWTGIKNVAVSFLADDPPHRLRVRHMIFQARKAASHFPDLENLTVLVTRYGITPKVEDMQIPGVRHLMEVTDDMRVMHLRHVSHGGESAGAQHNQEQRLDRDTMVTEEISDIIRIARRLNNRFEFTRDHVLFEAQRELTFHVAISSIFSSSSPQAQLGHEIPRYSCSRPTAGDICSNRGCDRFIIECKKS